MSGGSSEEWSDPIFKSKKTEKNPFYEFIRLKNAPPKADTKTGLPPGMTPAKFLLFFLEQFKKEAGIKDKSTTAAKLNPTKILQSLKGTEEKLKSLEEERNRFQTQDMRLFDEWKKEACAKELAKLNTVIDEHKALIEEVRALDVEYRAILDKKPEKTSKAKQRAKSAEDDFEEFLKKAFSDLDDEEDAEDSDDEDTDFHSENKRKNDFDDGEFLGPNQINFQLFYKTTGWTEDFLREVSKLSKKSRRQFIEHFFYQLVAHNSMSNFYEFFALTNSHAESLLELDEEKELNSALQSGDTSSQVKIHYRKLMRELHPDLRGADTAPSDFEKELFITVQSAYESGNLAGLKRAEVDLALFRGKVDASTDPKLLKKLQQEKAEKLKSVQSDLRKMKKNVEWDFQSKSEEEKAWIKTEIVEDITHQTKQIASEKQWIRRDIQMLKDRIRMLTGKQAKTARRAKPKEGAHVQEKPPASPESQKFHDELNSIYSR
jgi:hypothetical protein